VRMRKHSFFPGSSQGVSSLPERRHPTRGARGLCGRGSGAAHSWSCLESVADPSAASDACSRPSASCASPAAVSAAVLSTLHSWIRRSSELRTMACRRHAELHSPRRTHRACGGRGGAGRRPRGELVGKGRAERGRKGLEREAPEGINALGPVFRVAPCAPPARHPASAAARGRRGAAAAAGEGRRQTMSGMGRGGTEADDLRDEGWGGAARKRTI
jgi:hypothetical protein